MAATVRSSRSAGGSTCGGRLLDDLADLAVLVDDGLAVAAAGEMAVELGSLGRGQVAEGEVEGLGMGLLDVPLRKHRRRPSQAGQLGPQRVGRLGHPGFDGADRDAEALGDLGVGEAVPDQAHHISVDRRELVEGLVDGQDRERLVNGVVLGRQLEVLDGQERPGRGAPGDVVGRGAGHGEQPASYRAPAGVVVRACWQNLMKVSCTISSASPWSCSTWKPNLNSSLRYLR